MYTKKRIKLISIILIITFFMGLFNNYERQTVNAEAEENQSIIAQDMMKRFSVSESFIQENIDNGYNLNEIYAALYKAELEGISFEQALYLLFSKMVNESQTATTSVYNGAAGDSTPKMIIIEADKSTITGSVYNPDVTDSVYDSPSVTEGVYGNKGYQSMSLVETPPILETAPVYDKTKLSEAPYSVGINNESISSLSGSLSIQNVDMTLPGRNGLSFALTRQYDTDDAQYYDEKYGSEVYEYGDYKYYVQFNAIKKKILYRYTLKYNENKWIQQDYDKNGSIDYNTIPLSTDEKLRGTYETKAAAQAAMVLPLKYSINSDQIYKEEIRPLDNLNTIPNYIMYSQYGYSGALYKTGDPFKTSGSFTDADTKTGKDTCIAKFPGKYNSSKIWQSTEPGGSCGTSMFYDKDGYVGNLTTKVNSLTKDCPNGSTPGWICTKEITSYFSGLVTKPAVDNRKYSQKYNGYPTMPAYVSSTNYGPWVDDSVTGGRMRYAYEINGSQWIDIEAYDGPVEGDPVPLITPLYEYTTAKDEAISINGRGNTLAGTEDGYNYYYASNPNAELKTFRVGTSAGIRYFNDTSMPLNEKLYPIGKGWSWNLPHVQSEQDKLYVIMGNGGKYEVEGTNLKGSDWLGTSLTLDTTVKVNGISSKYVLTPIDGSIKQYFDQEGRIIQISDAYNNTIEFKYALENSTYNGRKLLSQVKDAIGNTIDIIYSSTEVKIQKGNEIVTYTKKLEGNMELLEYVVDAENRRTDYKYELGEAKFNLMNAYPERAKSNPYVLLKNIKHPTGMKTEYVYEAAPVKRYSGVDVMNEAYRISSRVDRLYYENGTEKQFNWRSMSYNNTDVGQSYGQDFTFSTTLNNGLTNVTTQYKKDFINDQTPMQVYLEQQKESADGFDKVANHAYTKVVGSRAYPVSAPTSTTLSGVGQISQ
ncbi:hypothetical protein [Paenibacillus sp. NRS-1760]|uniref:hypothetical protein n=1 Tax=Paenibacillus sp. NRS-1760 TaxID=3233902 RepID=UPI003D27C653